LLEVVKHVETCADIDFAAFLEDHINHLIVAHGRVVRHDYLVGQLLDYLLPDLAFVFPIVLAVEVVDEFEDCGIPHHLLDGVHPQKDSLFQRHEIGLETVVEPKVIERGGFRGVKVSATNLAQLSEFVLDHKALQAIVKKNEQ
jgi:hypothetical protein